MNPHQHLHTISDARDRIQSLWLVVLCLPLLACGVAFHAMRAWIYKDFFSLILLLGISAAFGFVVWRLRAATAGAAAIGGLICSCILLGTGRSVLHSAFLPLLTLFLLTFATTRWGRTKKQAMGVAEARTGRKASQVMANLGAAGMVAVLVPGHIAWVTACIAALAEATADTVSSELGQIMGGQPVLITTFRPVAAGTDGGITLAGSLAGIAGAAMVVMVAFLTLPLHATALGIAFLAGVLGLFVDSLLGATVERRGWLGNDLVNFTATAVAALCAAGLSLIWH
ncbi:MAG: DUF92 domain-containing protein [Acidobacteriaceae bacterium]